MKNACHASKSLTSSRKIFSSSSRRRGRKKIDPGTSYGISKADVCKFRNQRVVYILASQVAGTLYVGVTSDLVKRVSQHKDGTYGRFTAKDNVHRLVYYEEFGSIEAAIEREKKLKKWRREWKIKLIEEKNSKLRDLYLELLK